MGCCLSTGHPACAGEPGNELNTRPYQPKVATPGSGVSDANQSSVRGRSKSGVEESSVRSGSISSRRAAARRASINTTQSPIRNRGTAPQGVASRSGVAISAGKKEVFDSSTSLVLPAPTTLRAETTTRTRGPASSGSTSSRREAARCASIHTTQSPIRNRGTASQGVASRSGVAISASVKEVFDPSTSLAPPAPTTLRGKTSPRPRGPAGSGSSCYEPTKPTPSAAKLDRVMAWYMEDPDYPILNPFAPKTLDKYKPVLIAKNPYGPPRFTGRFKFKSDED